MFALVGLALYVVLGGADFGAGFWQLTAGRGRSGERIRDHAHDSMAPVWEANHVWLIFVLTVVWTAYPAAFGSIASTLSVALFIAAVGIIFRGAAYALRAGASHGARARAIDTRVRGLVDPDAVRARRGGRRDRLGPRAGRQRRGRPVLELAQPDLDLGRASLAVASAPTWRRSTCAADAARLGDARPRAAASACARSARASSPARSRSAGLIVVPLRRAPALRRARDRRRPARAGRLRAWPESAHARARLAAALRAARYSAALAVAAIIAGWALAQKPVFLPGLTVAAGGRTARHAGGGDRRGARRRRDPVPVARHCCSGCCCADGSTTRAPQREHERPGAAGRSAARAGADGTRGGGTAGRRLRLAQRGATPAGRTRSVRCACSASSSWASSRQFHSSRRAAARRPPGRIPGPRRWCMPAAPGMRHPGEGSRVRVRAAPCPADHLMGQAPL